MLRSGFLPGVVLLMLIVGCAPRVRFIEATARRVQSEGTLQAVAFTSTAETRGLAGQQLIYQVRLLDARMRPLRSANDKYRNAAGEVSATKALLAFDSPWRFENVTIAIPAAELEIAPADMPVGAEFALLDVNGVMLAQAFQRLPVYTATREGPPAPAYTRRAEPPPAPEAPPQQPPPTREAPAVAARPQPPEPQPEPEYRRRYTDAAPPARPAAPPSAAPDPPQAAARPTPAVTGGDALYQAIQAEKPEDRPAESAPPPAVIPARTQAPPAAPVRETILSRTPEQDPPSGPRPRIYVVQQGDTLTRIARRIYGDSARWIDLFEFNRHQLDSPDLIYDGLELLIPPEQD